MARRSGRELSDLPLGWLADEATKCGLEFEPQLLAGRVLDPQAPQHESHRAGWKLLGKAVRKIPSDAWIHHSVKARAQAGTYESEALEDLLARVPWSKVRIEP